ncbi:MAG: HAMP domain-containing protein, partial [Magnetovibrio sp.]|nr:HAMP domain-containing protein [Magnetovibrio sp.]
MEMANYRDASRAVPHLRAHGWRERSDASEHTDMMDRMMRGRGGPFGHFQRGDLEQDGGRRVLLLSYRLLDGSWVTFLTPPAPVRPLWGTRFFLPSALSLLLVLGLSVWAVRRSTKPLNRFELAAERLGVDVNAPPMGEDGPREVRRAAKAFNRMQSRLQAFVKDRTHMLAAISHDLRTPITRLRLRAEFVDDEEQRFKMLSDLDEMEAMIAATLQFARDDATAEPTKPLDLAVLVRGLCDDAQRAGDDVTCSGLESLTFNGREVGLKRMVANLIGNAVRYGERARVDLSADDAQVCLRVSDDGPGIP